MPTVSFGTFSKRRNSTKQPATLSDQRTVRLKETTSVDHPTFILTGDQFDYNYAQWGSRYYFIEDIRSAHNGLTEVDCILDVLATYKAEILASTQYVCYSSVSGGNWLSDTRIPVLKSTTVSKNSVGVPFFNSNGIFILSVVGGDTGGVGGCEIFAVNKSTLNALVDEISNWANDAYTAAISIIDPQTYSGTDFAGAVNALSQSLASFADAQLQGDLVGNAYKLAPQCIRSCIWVPFDITQFTGSSGSIYLGNFDTHQAGFKVDAKPFTGSTTVTIPWHYNDWRRSTCEDVYLFLPLVGMVGLSSDNLTHASSITVKYSCTATDGNVCYQVICGNEIIGSYGANCSTNYPIGINQQASAGDVLTSVLHGVEHTVAEAVDAGVNVISSGAELAVGLSAATVDTVNTAMSTNLTTIGGIGGGAGVGLDMNITCYTVSHDTIVNPSDMQQTMGIPTMKPIALSSCTGYCQCANAHVDAPAMASELNAIDLMLNSGFYIE